jgi:hypothetical protein
MPEPLGASVKGARYRRPVKDKPYRVIWQDGSRWRSKAFAWWGPAREEMDRHDHVLLVHITRGEVADRPLFEHSFKWREPTERERDVIMAMGMTYEAR